MEDEGKSSCEKLRVVLPVFLVVAGLARRVFKQLFIKPLEHAPGQPPKPGRGRLNKLPWTSLNKAARPIQKDRRPSASSQKEAVGLRPPTPF